MHEITTSILLDRVGHGDVVTVFEHTRSGGRKTGLGRWIFLDVKTPHQPLRFESLVAMVDEGLIKRGKKISDDRYAVVLTPKGVKTLKSALSQ